MAATADRPETTSTELRMLRVLVYPSPLFAAHWSLWLPYTDAEGLESHIGDRIHATGDRLNGFRYEYLQDYDAREDSRRPVAFPIGRIPAAGVSKKEQEEPSADGPSAVLNLLDQTCRQVPVPGPSLNRVVPGAAAAGSAPRKVEVRDCQWWIRQAVAHLVESGILLPLEEAQGGDPSARVDMLPAH